MKIVFSDEIIRQRRFQLFLIFSIVAGLIAAILGIVREYAVNSWLAQKENVSCVPSTIESALPFVYYQSSYHPVQEQTKINNFIRQYVHLTRDESYINHHRISKDGRYDDQRLSKNYLQAVELSTGIEQAINKKRYIDSNETYQFLKKNDVSWDFLIDAILVQGLSDAGAARVVVRGQYQITYDKAKIDVDNRLYGYKEITYIVMIGAPIGLPPSMDGSPVYINRYGLYVADSFERNLTPLQQKELNDKAALEYIEK